MSQPSWWRLPEKLIEPVKKTAPPSSRGIRTRSAWTFGLRAPPRMRLVMLKFSRASSMLSEWPAEVATTIVSSGVPSSGSTVSISVPAAPPIVP